MDCTNARVLLRFVRTGEIEASERDLLESHVSGCPDCTAHARAEGQFDDALEYAMPRLSVPAGLKGRIMQSMARARRPRRWRWAIAAAVTLTAGVGAYMALAGGTEEIDAISFVQKVDRKAPEEVESTFLSWGVEMTSPREFNFELLDSFDIAEIQGRRVAKLTFLSHGNGRAALAHVYVLSTDHFKLPAQHQEEAARQNGWSGDIVIAASTRNIQIRRYDNVPEFFFMVVYNSQSLEPFLLRGI